MWAKNRSSRRDLRPTRFRFGSCFPSRTAGHDRSFLRPRFSHLASRGNFYGKLERKKKGEQKQPFLAFESNFAASLDSSSGGLVVRGRLAWTPPIFGLFCHRSYHTTIEPTVPLSSWHPTNKGGDLHASGEEWGELGYSFLEIDPWFLEENEGGKEQNVSINTFLLKNSKNTF